MLKGQRALGSAVHTSIFTILPRIDDLYIEALKLAGIASDKLCSSSKSDAGYHLISKVNNAPNFIPLCCQDRRTLRR